VPLAEDPTKSIVEISIVKRHLGEVIALSRLLMVAGILWHSALRPHGEVSGELLGRCRCTSEVSFIERGSLTGDKVIRCTGEVTFFEWDSLTGDLLHKGAEDL